MNNHKKSGIKTQKIEITEKSGINEKKLLPEKNEILRIILENQE